MKDCVFCQIVKKEKEAGIIYEDDQVVAFPSYHPLAKVHLLIVPKKHISSIQEMKEDDEFLMGHLVFVAKRLAQERGLQGYHLLCNVGAKGGQTVFHVHLHLLSSDAQLLS